MKPVVIYHDNCTDGFGAAFAVWMKFGDNAVYHPCNYGDIGHPGGSTGIEDLVHGEEVYILDFSFPRPLMDYIFANARRVVWLDHHKTAFEMWCGKYERGMVHTEGLEDSLDWRVDHNIILNDNESGALLAWKYFHPNTEIPLGIRYIDDRDRWQFELPFSKDFHAGLSIHKPWSFDQWYLLLNDHITAELVRDGNIVVLAQEQNVISMAKNAQPSYIWKHCGDSHDERNSLEVTGLAVNACLHQSELGHELANQSNTYGLVWHVTRNNRVRCSLRSNGNYDVSVIAKAFGGGGHKNAAGFEIDIDTLMGWLK